MDNERLRISDHLNQREVGIGMGGGNGKIMGECQKFEWKNPKYGKNLVVGVILGQFGKIYHTFPGFFPGPPPPDHPENFHLGQILSPEKALSFSYHSRIQPDKETRKFLILRQKT